LGIERLRNIELGKITSIDFKLDQHKEGLKPIFHIILLCGRQGIALRGHRDDGTNEKGNDGHFRAILRLISQDDDVLKINIMSMPKNATAKLYRMK